MCETFDQNNECILCGFPSLYRDIRFGADFGKDVTVITMAEVKNGIMKILDMKVFR